MIKFLDNYVQKIARLTVVVIDNAPIHTSKAFQQKIAEWRRQKLEIFWLPTYSPQLNLIEREMCRGFLGLQNRAVENLWRFMKYEWIEVEGRSGFPTMPNRLVEKEAYSSWKNLVEYVEKVLKDFGTEYTINFA